MGVFLFFLSLLGAAIFAVLLASSVLTANLTAMMLAAVGLAIALPFPGRTMVAVLGRWSTVLRAVLGIGLVLGTAFTMLVHQHSSIYRNDDVRKRFHALYDEKMQDWPLPFEDRFIDTKYGTVHVVVSGSEDGPPMVLLHASSVGSWSWRSNAAELGENFQLFAVDLIGDAGKSEYTDLSKVMRSREDQAALYDDIMAQLDISEPAIVVGASEGGFIASNIAVHRPERVDRLILLGPMGYAGATDAILRILGAQFFPLRPIQDATFRWAFSNAPNVIAEFSAWFELLMSDTFPVKVAPLPLPPEERQSITAPTLFVFGTRDNLVGDPDAAHDLVSDMPDVTVEVIEAGHLMAVERAIEVNALILGFLKDRP